MSSTFGQDVLRQLGFTEKEFETIAILSKLVNPGHVLDLDTVQRGLEGRLMKLKQIRAEGKTELYTEAIVSYQKASQPFLHFKAALTQMRAHVLNAAGSHLQPIRDLLTEFEHESMKPELSMINVLVQNWKDTPETGETACLLLINFVYSPLERNQLFSRESAIEGIRKAKRDVYFLPTLAAVPETFAEELKLAHWIVGRESTQSDTEILLQFFLHLNRESAEESSKATTYALAIRKIGHQLRDYVKLLHLKLALAKAFQLTPEDENWTPAIDVLLEKFDAIAILAETLGLEYGREYESFVGNFDVIGVKQGLYSTVDTIYSSSECTEHWWPMHWLGVKDAADLKTKNIMVRETMQLMPAREIFDRLEMILKREGEKNALNSTLENGWMDWV
jgi:hypothetical protein